MGRASLARLALVTWIGAGLVLVGCDDECSCRELKASTRVEIGSPDEYDTYDEEGYFSETWIYYDLGRVYFFEEGELVCCCCDLSVSEFEPIP